MSTNKTVSKNVVSKKSANNRADLLKKATEIGLNADTLAELEFKKSAEIAEIIDTFLKTPDKKAETKKAEQVKITTNLLGGQIRRTKKSKNRSILNCLDNQGNLIATIYASKDEFKFDDRDKKIDITIDNLDCVIDSQGYVCAGAYTDKNEINPQGYCIPVSVIPAGAVKLVTVGTV